MSHLPYAIALVLLLAGLVGVATTRNYIHAVGCLLVVQASTYVLLISVGAQGGSTAPVIERPGPAPRVADPVVQAMALTDIVVGAAVAALLLALAVEAAKRSGTLDPRRFRPLQG